MYSLDRILIDKFRKSIQSEIEDARYVIGQGNLGDIIEYKKTCARIEGLSASLDIFNDLVKTLEETE